MQLVFIELRNLSFEAQQDGIYLLGLGSRASATCKPQRSQPFTDLKKSKPDRNIEIPLQNFSKTFKRILI